MPRCYLLAVSKSSSLDESTNSWSLFNLVEEVQIGGGLSEEEVLEARPVLPYEIHVQWEFQEDEIGTPFEFKISIDLEGQDPSESQAVNITSEHRRNRVRMTGVQVPGVGSGQVRAQWREAGDEDWELEPVAWPIEFSVSATDAEPALPLED